MPTCEKTKGTKFHIYLGWSAKRASVRIHTSTCTRGKTHILLDLFAKDTACMHGKTHVDLLLDQSAKDTTVELMYVNMHVHF